MYKTIALIGRRPGLSHDEFREYYERYHAPWALSLVVPGLRRYVRNYIDPAAGTTTSAAHDVVTEFWWNDRASYDAFVALRQDPEIGARLTADEERFMDRDSVIVYHVDEVEQVDAVLGMTP